MTLTQQAILVAAGAVATMLTRFIPFLGFPSRQAHSQVHLVFGKGTAILGFRPIGGLLLAPYLLCSEDGIGRLAFHPVFRCHRPNPRRLLHYRHPSMAQEHDVVDCSRHSLLHDSDQNDKDTLPASYWLHQLSHT